MYKNNGKQVLFVEGGVTTHIADAGDTEKAHAIAYHLNNKSSNYIRNARATLSPSFFGEKISKAHFTGRINGAIDALNKLDQVKKTLFYGRDNNLEPASGARSIEGLNERVGSGGANGANIAHAIIGVATEAGELLEALKADYNQNEVNTLDSVNIREEVGDLFWYLAILAHECDFDFEEAQRINIAKLRARYADKFDQLDANERDLAAERAILEDKNDPLIADAPIDKNINEALAPKLDLVASTPATGRGPVEQVAREADAAFSKVLSKGADMIDTPATGSQTGEPGNELHKPIAARRAPFAHEKMAHQPVRREDLDKS